jgi:hypothetical protein
MSRTEKPEADQVKHSLRDNELDAVIGGIANAFANFSDIKGKTTDAKTPSPPSPVPLPYPVLGA